MRRILLTLAMTVGLAIGIVAPVSALDTSVTLNCSDGTSVKLALDADSLTSLTQAVQAMIDYPAGLSCTLIQNPLGVTFGSVALAASSPFIVAGGRWQVPCAAISGPPPLTGAIEGSLIARVPGAWYSLSPQQSSAFFWVNIAVNFHLDKNNNPFGTLNETIPGNQSCPTFDSAGTPNGSFPVGESHFQSTPVSVCFPASQDLPVFVTSRVTHVSGQVDFPTGGTSNSSGFVPGPPVRKDDILHFGFQDNGNPPGQNPRLTPPTTDMLAGPPATPEGDQISDCNNLEWTPTFHLGTNDPVDPSPKQFGNISVHL